jgi:hypothetical protein
MRALRSVPCNVRLIGEGDPECRIREVWRTPLARRVQRDAASVVRWTEASALAVSLCPVWSLFVSIVSGRFPIAKSGSGVGRWVIVAVNDEVSVRALQASTPQFNYEAYVLC